MITPTFKVDQDSDSLTITIKTPYVRAQDVDLYVEGCEFRFYLRPYFLRLHFPGNIVEDDLSKAVYDPSVGQFTIRVSKETKGEFFPDLDLLTKLLARTGESSKEKNGTADQKEKKPLIEVVGSSENSNTEQQLGDEEIQDAIEFNWELPQELPSSSELYITSHYGFNDQYNGYFTHVHETMNEINEITDVEKSTTESRRQERLQKENSYFDEDHYCMDFANSNEIEELLKYKTSTAVAPLNVTNKDSLLKFTSQEEAMMRDLPNKAYLLSFEKGIYLGLVDLLLAYSYNHRVTEGENNVESVWCIGKISSTLSSLEQFTTLKEVIISFYRRALIYPLYRHFGLCEKVLQDVYILFRLGKRAILKTLLEMKHLFDHHDVYYIYSKLYLDDYCIWVQLFSDNVLRTLAHELHHFNVKKNELGWDLVELEEVRFELFIACERLLTSLFFLQFLK
ncbi:SHQ1 protein-domain-containing protein [Mycotypha africana]|uniref:SHQ1 protein-domain-containing protein n=1 Tax=Mycotypha africana TaxID=64632 RepID=UPI0023013F86|nr:SHQ1 protein-domain-containing protein [Mycotypha africana]KAI8979860.1 SHQ1 protein-domain-containing protein [Mycotypha africana]